MASARKKLDEKNLKILRELAALPANKYCFDCHQRGPTYVNITIGSFVCTKCSGILRGLTPPHRVKSISMATFTQEEVDIIKSKGNQYCQNVWLGLCETEPTTKDELQIKDFMIDKYEKRRYYVEPSIAERMAPNGTSSQSSSTLVMSVNKPKVQSSTANAINKNIYINGNDVVNTGSKLVDPFESPQTEQSSFANFDNNPIFTSAPASQGTGALLAPLSNNVTSTKPPAPSEDRYAALKDLDSLMKSQNVPIEKPSETSKDPWGANNNSNGLWGSPDSNRGFNPFAVDGWGCSANVNQVTTVGNNPFKDLKHTDWGISNGSNGISSSQSFTAFQWSNNSNPFTVGSGNGGTSSSGFQSSNPFL